MTARKPKTLWIVSGGIEAVPGIRRAKEMGLYVVVSDGNPQAPGLKLADHACVLDTYDEQGHLQAAREFSKRRRLDGILCVAADVPRTVAAVAQALDLPGPSWETARLATDKLAMKEHFLRAGIPIPRFKPVNCVSDLVSAIHEWGLPVVLKPVDSRGARGVLRITRGLNLEWAIRHSRAFSPSGRLMVEEYLAGPQISTESIFLGALASTPGFSDRNYEYLERFSPFIVENGGTMPSVLGPSPRQKVVALAEKAARVLGINWGTAKGDMVLTAQGPKVIEMAARLSGGWFATDQIPLATGVDMLGIAIRLALGNRVEPWEIQPRAEKAVAIRYFFPRIGQILRLPDPRQLAAFSWIHRCELLLAPGNAAPAVTDHTKRSGFVITLGATREESIIRATSVTEWVTGSGRKGLTPLESFQQFSGRSRRTGGQAVLARDGVVDFPAVDRDLSRGADPYPNLIVANGQDPDLDGVTDHQTLAGLSGENEH